MTRDPSAHSSRFTSRVVAVCGVVTSLFIAVAIDAHAQDREMMARVFGQVPPIATSAVDAEVPAGSIVVSVVDSSGVAVDGAAIRLGIMKASSSRDSINGVTGADGTYTFKELPTGTAQAYRVNVPHEGAQYSSTPFRLDADKGQRVTVRRLSTTQDLSRLLQVLGRTVIEFKDNRVHVTQEAQLANVSPSTFVFPDPGLAIHLPTGFTAFQSPASMTDQRIGATEQGIEIRGSIPPGRVTLRWAYDLPRRGSEMSFEQHVPFRTMEYQVMSDFVAGMKLEAEGFAPQFVHDTGERQFLVRRLGRRPSDPPLTTVRVTLTGLPGTKALPWMASTIALAFLLGAGWFAFRRLPHAAPIESLETTTTAKVDEIHALDAERSRGEIGPQFHERERRRLVDELALLLRERSGPD